jgi:uncharacterized membrane protein required for colicin V production
VGLNVVDGVAIAVVLVSALGGLRRGLVLSAFSLVGLAVGAYVGSRLAPHLLTSGSNSAWTAAAGLVGAVAGAMLLQLVALTAGSTVRGGLRLTPLRALDSAGGLFLGAAIGVAIVWVGAAVALLVPDQTRLRQEVQGSAIVRQLNAALPPRTLLNLLSRIDPFPSIAGPKAPSLPPSTGILRDPSVRSAATRVVKVLGTACGVGVEGSGWFAARDLVVTAAHVVAGEQDTSVRLPGQLLLLGVKVVVLDVHDDVAVLRVPGANEKPLALAEPQPGTAVAILGYPLDGDLVGRAGRIGNTSTVLTQDALGGGPVDPGRRGEGRARRLRWAGSRRRGSRRVHDLRRARRLGERLRRSALHHPARPRPGRYESGLDRRLRPLRLQPAGSGRSSTTFSGCRKGATT